MHASIRLKFDFIVSVPLLVRLVKTNFDDDSHAP